MWGQFGRFNIRRYSRMKKLMLWRPGYNKKILCLVVPLTDRYGKSIEIKKVIAGKSIFFDLSPGKPHYLSANDTLIPADKLTELIFT